MRILFVLLFIVTGCKEFYDEDFTGAANGDANEESRTTSSVSSNDSINKNYSATLKSTDFSIPNLKGSASVNVANGKVKVNVQMSGIPSNIIQLHYVFIKANCQNLHYSLPADTSAKKTPRSYSIYEEISTDSLAQDLASSGASTFGGDIGLIGKSLVIKAFYNFSGLPTNTGTNQITIACGEVKGSSNN